MRHLLLGERRGDIKEREPKVGKRKRESQGKSKRARVSRPEVSYDTRESGTADAREGERERERETEAAARAVAETSQGEKRSGE
jgi:hypothetical protein